MTWNKTQFTEFFVQNGMWYFFPFLYRNLEWTGTSLKKVERPSLVLVGSGRKCVWSCFSKWLFWKVQKKIKKLKTTFDFRLMLEIQGFQCLPGEVLASGAILWTLWANCCCCFRTVRVPFNGKKSHGGQSVLSLIVHYLYFHLNVAHSCSRVVMEKIYGKCHFFVYQIAHNFQEYQNELVYCGILPRFGKSGDSYQF